MKQEHKTPDDVHSRFVPLLLFGVLLLGVLVVGAADAKRVAHLLYHAHAGPLAAAMLATAGSIWAVTLSYRNLFRVAGRPVQLRRLFGVTLVCNAFNVILSSGGLSGTAVRSLLLKRDGVPHSVTLPVSMAQAMLSNLVMAVLCAAVSTSLWHPALQEGFPIGRVLFVGVFILAAVVSVQAGGFFLPAFRGFLFQAVESVLGRFALRWRGLTRLKTRVEEVNQKLNDCAHLLGRKPADLGRSFMWISGDWGCYFLALAACFAAVKAPMGPEKLLVAFAAVFLTTEVSVTPSGLGVAEGFVAWLLVRRGIPVEQTLAAMLLFRAVYFFLPLAAALVFHLDMIREGWRKGGAEH